MSDHETRGSVSPDDITAESPFTLPGFFDALGDGQLLGGICEDCGAVLIPPRPVCYSCGSRTVRIEEQPHTGDVITYTEVRTPPPAFADDAPYTIAVVELTSSGRLTGRVDAPYEEVKIGTSVELTVREPTTAEREAALSHETEWPIHVFKLR
jgi:uncharacterized OB-fold protein